MSLPSTKVNDNELFYGIPEIGFFTGISKFCYINSPVKVIYT